mgnify:CR=1 FL=1
MYTNVRSPYPGAGMQPGMMPPPQAQGYPPMGAYGAPSPSTVPTHLHPPAQSMTASTIAAVAPGMTQSNIGPAASPYPPTHSPGAARAAEKVVLYQGPREREKYDNMADLYAIIKTVEHLEKAYVKDAVTAEEYEPACTKLIAQYRTACGLVEMNVDEFAALYKLDCPAALKRLKAGIPATMEHRTGTAAGGGNQQAVVAQVVQHFITALDTVRLGNGDQGNVSVDQILPYLRDILDALNKMPALSPDFVGKVKVKEWIMTLTPLSASYQLSDDQVRQISFDLESSHDAFYRSLTSSQ